MLDWGKHLILYRALCLVGLLVLSGDALAKPLSPGEVRGVWVIRHNLTSAEKIDSVFAVADRLNLTDLFVQVRGRADAYYRSKYEPPAEELPADFDPLRYVLLKNAGHRFRIHAWVNVFYSWSKPEKPLSGNHLINKNPQWQAVSIRDFSDSEAANAQKGSPDSEGVFTSPLLPDVQQHIINILTDIVSHYEVDGIHLDYLRYPGPQFDFNPEVRRLFKRRYIFDPLEFIRTPEKFSQQYGMSGYELYYTRWSRFLKNGLTDFVKQISEKLRAEHPQLIISAAVKPELPRAHWEYYQDWDRWLKEGLIDWALPMNYARSTEIFWKRSRLILESVEAAKIVMGIALYNQSAEQALAKVDLLETLPFRGFVLFSYDQIQENINFQKAYITEINTMGE